MVGKVTNGGMAQSVEHIVHIDGVVGSSPTVTTTQRSLRNQASLSFYLRRGGTHLLYTKFGVGKVTVHLISQTFDVNEIAGRCKQGAGKWKKRHRSERARFMSDQPVMIPSACSLVVYSGLSHPGCCSISSFNASCTNQFAEQIFLCINNILYTQKLTNRIFRNTKE